MSRYNKFLWIVVAVLAGVMIFQFFFLNRKPAYRQVYYRSEYIFSPNSSAVTILSVAKFDFKNASDMNKAVSQFKKMSKTDKLKAYKKMFVDLAKKTKVNVDVLDYQSTLTTFGATGLKIEEKGVISGITKKDGKYWKIGMGSVEMKLDANAKVIFKFPSSWKIVSVVPTPTFIKDNILTWEGPMNLKFPEVEFEK